ncbi:uncharacterized protein [Medicago truncatula]|uniref:uncharacterized protein n=1 Tax=Medicago truncatula TaxID=3880 RepID=UPI000D2F2CF8|nr:uncharacterized protein LOC112420490 [Medicago truncatula]
MGTLTKPFSMDEVKAAMWDCDSFKSPGPDGINFGFIKNFWHEMKDDILRFTSEFHRNGKLSKVLANRLRQIIGSVVSEVQSAFVKNRQILDGILIANEVVDEARKSKKELLMFKVDFEKAYDSVDWTYLDEVMGSMSFPTLWRKWIKECVCTATASVLVNGSPTDEFPLERGYNVGGANSVVVSHLQFADDTLLIGNKSWANVRAMRAGLVLFEAMSGLKVNFHKSSLVGVNINASWLAEAASVLGCKVVNKVVTIRNMFQLGLEVGGGAWQWRRRLWVWEEELVEECRELLLTVTLQDSSSDRWLWLPDQTGGWYESTAFLFPSNLASVCLDIVE